MVFNLKQKVKKFFPNLKKEKPDWEIKYEFKQQFFRCAFKAIEYNGIDGDYLEFGCHGGMTFGMAYKEIERRKLPVRMWAFDSFEGLPPCQGAEDQHPKWVENSMKTSLEEFNLLCSRNGIPSNKYETVVGYYEDSLNETSEIKLPNNICLAYIDCDLYSSTKTILEFLKPRLKHGMIIAFDDYYWWSSENISGERRAMLEFFDNNPQWNLDPYIQYGWASKSFVVENRKLLEGLGKS
ncbi:TylF/MycF/NovP-related O-methyltransferase [Aphanothece sacrum]|uniref:Methyltransferase n=1 Tax=Aphanothece sacrum FPU1 TaxID=1920663 RepID=A0A401IIW4_APHSA|nr:TylF/MycF/NovP-related O-methyltransferase [Aphanothece sacrum]GBF81255.1 methyltransferase [Aphanothece sacrum FPU1]GBF83395.1 methyltransferase [Aphanothece sacrum FPU3]